MTNDIRIYARQLDIHADHQRVVWRETDDMQIALARGKKETGVMLPSTADGGYVLVGLQMDGDDDSTTIATSEGFEHSPVEVIDNAIAALTLLRDALTKINN